MAYLENLIGNDTSSRLLNLLCLLCLWPITLWIYNLYFHPLAKFPGPILWRASRLPYMRAAWGKHFPYVIEKLHKRYGDIVRVAPNELSCSNPTAWDDIYSNRDGANPHAFNKSEIWHGNPSGGPTSIFNTTEPKQHARVRRFLDPAFSERAVLRQEPILQHYVDLCIQKLHERASATGRVTVNIADWFNFILFDIIGDLSFGESFGCLEDCEFESWMDQMAASIKLNYLSIQLKHYPILTKLLSWKPISGFLVPKEIIEQHMDYRKRATAKLKRRLAPDAAIDRPDFVSQLMRSEDGGEGLTEEEVMLNCMLFINAASETTATTLTGLVNILLQDPESLAKLKEEIRSFESVDELTLKVLKDLPYLNAVLKEALRMYNPIPTGHMRITPPNGGIVSGHFVPGNTLLTIQPLTIYTSPKYFHDSKSWHPERWLHDAETNPQSPYFNDSRKSVRAFGSGPYNCVGEPLGWAWMRLITAKLVWTFDLERAKTGNESIVWDRQDVFGIVIKHRLDVTIAERTG